MEAIPEWKRFYREQARSRTIKSPEAQRLVAEFERSHEALVEQYNIVIWLCNRMLVAEARTLNDLDHLLAEERATSSRAHSERRVWP